MSRNKPKYLILIMLTTLLLASVLSGCKRFDKSAYVQAALDSIYKGNHQNFSEITNTDTSTLEAHYEEAINAEMISFINYIGIGDYADKISPDIKKEISELIRQIYKHTSYSVGSEDENGHVPVKILPVAVYSLTGDQITAYMTEFFSKNDKGEFAKLTDQEFYDCYVHGIIQIISGSLSAISYSNEITVNVSVNRDGTVYSISDESFAEIDKVILDYTL